MRLKRFSKIFYFILILGCSKEIKDTENQVKLSSIKEVDLSNIEIEGIIPLETNSNNLMGLDLRVLLGDSLIYVMDESTKDGIHIFGEKGNFLQTIANVGEGPENIPTLIDFYVTESGTIEVLSPHGFFVDVYRFDLEGDFHKIFSLEYGYFIRKGTRQYLFVLW